MKKLILFSALLLIATSISFYSCNKKPKNPQITARERILIDTFRGAIDSIHSGRIEIWKHNDTFYAYRQIVARASTDKMGVKAISTACGTWSKVNDTTAKITIPTLSDLITIIPMMANVPRKDLNAGDQSFCCECADRNKCCMAYTFGSGYFCTNCESNSPCHFTCITVYDDGIIKIHGSMAIFTYQGLTANNLKIIDVQ